MELREVKKTHSKKKKLMLWIDTELVEALDVMKPPAITVQECIRQIIAHYVNESDDELEGL